MSATAVPKLAVVFGGSGFVGRYVVRALAGRGYRVRVAVRRPDLAIHLKPLGDLGQIQLVQANIRFRQSVEAAVHGADTVVNLVGTFDAAGRNNFDAVHILGAKAIADATKKAGARLVHMSAIGADVNSKSGYGRSKGRGEQAVKSSLKNATVIRPSVVFGQEDEFFNRFAAMAKISPIIPMIGADTRFQPVYVGDVAEAIARAAAGEIADGTIYELGGAEVLTFRQCMEVMLEEICRNRILVNLPWVVSSAIATLTGWLPYAPITSDQVEMLKSDNVVSDSARRDGCTLEGIGIEPVTLETILPTYLVQYRPHGQFTNPVGGES